MFRNQVARTTAKVVVAIGILMSMLLAGGAPGDFGIRKSTATTQVAP